MSRKFWTYLLSIAAALSVGGLAALLTRGSMERFENLVKPTLAPPAAVFPIVWSILFVLMGISAAMVWCSRDKRRGDALFFYGAQLFVNFFWSIFFFNLEIRLVAFFWLLLLLALVIVMVLKFGQISKTAAWLQIPYLAWLLFAAYLNLFIYLLNR